VFGGAGEKVAELARLRRRRFISQPSEEAEGTGVFGGWARKLPSLRGYAEGVS